MYTAETSDERCIKKILNVSFAYLCSSTSGKLPRPLAFCVVGRCSGAGGAAGGASSASPVEAKTSPPRASNNSACFVFLDPSFKPLPLKAGARAGVGVEVCELREAEEEEKSGVSKRGTEV